MSIKFNIGFIDVLTFTLVLFKIFGIIAWSWWIVFLPMLINLGIGLFILILVAIVTVVALLKG